MKNSHENIVRVLKAFCYLNRIKTIEILQNKEKRPCMLQEKLNIGQSTFSHYLKVLSNKDNIENIISKFQRENKNIEIDIIIKAIQNQNTLLSIAPFTCEYKIQCIIVVKTEYVLHQLTIYLKYIIRLS